MTEMSTGSPRSSTAQTVPVVKDVIAGGGATSVPRGEATQLIAGWLYQLHTRRTVWPSVHLRTTGRRRRPAQRDAGAEQLLAVEGESAIELLERMLGARRAA